VGSWTADQNHRADEVDYCPRYTPALTYALRMLQSARRYAMSRYGLRGQEAVRFALAAYNAGIGGASSGYKSGDVDVFTTGSDYSAWVYRHRVLVHRWLQAHDNWLVQPSN
jgi:hypothetical protein